jgi:endonuclease III
MTKAKGRPTKPKTNWEDLSKKLQAALESSIKDNKLLENQKKEIIRTAHELEKQVVGLEAVIELLEEKLDRAHSI